MYNRELVEYFLSYKLSQRNYPSSLLRPDDADGGAEEQRSPAALNSFLVSSRNRRVGIEAVKAALQDSTEEFEQLFAQTFDEFSPQLSITSYQTFKDVMDETFNDGVTWGRIVGLFAFGGVLCLKCAEKDAGKPVCHIADWMTIYLDEHINPWIQSQGGWEYFAKNFGKDAAAEGRRTHMALRRMLVGMVLLIGVLLIIQQL